MKKSSTHFNTGKGSKDIVSISRLRLPDHIATGLRILFVGINPGVRSAMLGHHFAGYSNRFWKLLNESGLATQPLTSEMDHRLLSWNLGMTNLIARPTPGISDLRPEEYVDGWKLLERKIRKYRPRTVAFVGVTLYRAILPLLGDASDDSIQHVLGIQPVRVHGSSIFVLPNPSGRNANYSYSEMLTCYTELRRWDKNLLSGFR